MAEQAENTNQQLDNDEHVGIIQDDSGDARPDIRPTQTQKKLSFEISEGEMHLFFTQMVHGHRSLTNQGADPEVLCGAANLQLRAKQMIKSHQESSQSSL